MHTAVLVIGDNPEQRAKGIDTRLGTTDWAGIGGRYTGLLMPRPGATTGRVYGDTLPSFEAAIAGHMPEGITSHRPGADPGPGVDQLRGQDLDVATTIDGFIPPYVLDADGGLHGPDFTPEEEGLLTAISLASMYPGVGIDLDKMELDADDLDKIDAKQNTWNDRLAELLGDIGPDDLVTVVDIHT